MDAGIPAPASALDAPALYLAGENDAFGAHGEMLGECGDPFMAIERLEERDDG